MMSEAEWLACCEPGPMLQMLRSKPSDRKMRLFACASCRGFGCLPRPLDGILKLIEDYADHQIGKRLLSERIEELDASLEIATEPDGSLIRAVTWAGIIRSKKPYHVSDWSAAADWAAEAAGQDFSFKTRHTGSDPQTEAVRAKTRSTQCSLIRDIFGNPFRPVTVNPAWLTPMVTTLAQTIYDGRAFDKMPELADALQEAGCDNEDVLSHCRGPGPHVKGCWVVDLLLGRE